MYQLDDSWFGRRANVLNSMLSMGNIFFSNTALEMAVDLCSIAEQNRNRAIMTSFIFIWKELMCRDFFANNVIFAHQNIV